MELEITGCPVILSEAKNPLRDKATDSKGDLSSFHSSGWQGNYAVILSEAKNPLWDKVAYFKGDPSSAEEAGSGWR